MKVRLRKVSVSVGRKITDGMYGSHDAHASVEMEVEDNGESLESLMKETRTELQREVFRALVEQQKNLNGSNLGAR